MKIKVLQEDIDKGIKGNARHCPVALAIKRTIGEVEVVVGPDNIFVARNRYKTPLRVKYFIDDFDSRKLFRFRHIKPFEFELEEGAI